MGDATVTNLAPGLDTSLFHIKRSVIPSLARLMDVQGAGDLSYSQAETILRLASLEALRWLQQVRDSEEHLLIKQAYSTSAGTVHSRGDSAFKEEATQARDLDHDATGRQTDGLPVLNNSIDFSTLPTPNRLLQATLRRALEECQASRASTPSNPMRPIGRKSSVLPVDVGIQRWALSSLLHHYLGEDFGQVRRDDGVTLYARDERDDLAIRELFPDPRRFSVVQAELASISPSTESTDQPQQSETPASHDEINRDDKLKWLLGEAVASHTLRRTSPLPGPLALPSQTKVSQRRSRMVARSPTAGGFRRNILHDQEWLSDADGLEKINTRRRSSSALSEPLSPAHRRAWSAGTDLSDIRLVDPYARDNHDERVSNRVYARQSFDTTSSMAEWQGGVSLTRIDSCETYNSQSHLIKHGNKLNEALGKVSVAEPADFKTSVDSATKGPTRRALQSFAASTLRDGGQSNQPFTNLFAVGSRYEVRPSRDAEPVAMTLPSTSNQLSNRDKQDLLRKNRKLKAMLGTEVLEDRSKTGVQVLRSEVWNVDTTSKCEESGLIWLLLSGR